MACALQVCCFDKTGTLTSDHLLLEGLVGVPGRGGELVTELQKLPNSVAEVRGR
jgi:cation-transporting ATPase 13A1